MLPGFKYSTFNDIAVLPSLITDNTCGVMVEPIQGEGGINVATPAFLSALREHCTRVGAVLIFDEIQCGLSRTGTLWAYAQPEYPSSVYPDILTTAKALGNGIPIGATLINDTVASHIKTGDHGTTFGGNPLACRVAHYVFSRLADPKFQASIHQKSKFFSSELESLKSRHPDLISEVRGRGLILGAQLSKPELASNIVTAARERGLLVITAGEGCLRFVPPLVISEQEMQKGMEILESAVESVAAAEGSVRGTGGQQEMKTQ
jgi:acetylornithine aminotransferase